MAETIKAVLMNRDGISETEADELISEATDTLEAYLDDGDFIGAEDVCADYFGLELDYVDELMVTISKRQSLAVGA